MATRCLTLDSRANSIHFTSLELVLTINISSLFLHVQQSLFQSFKHPEVKKYDKDLVADVQKHILVPEN